METPSILATIPVDRHARWQLARDFIAQWFPNASRIGLNRPPTGTGMPIRPPACCAALSEWFELVSELPGIWSQQDVPFGDCSRIATDEFLIIAVENQSCAYWGVRRNDLLHDDPPVFFDANESHNWELVNTTTSEFALTWLASSVKFSKCNRCWACAYGNPAAVQIVRHQVPRLGLSDWNWPETPTRFYGTSDLLVEIAGDSDRLIWWVATRTKSTFERVCLLLAPAAVQWDSSSAEWPDGWVSAAEDLL